MYEYLAHAVVHTMAGKVIARAVVAHQLVDRVLNVMIVSDALDDALLVQSGQP